MINHIQSTGFPCVNAIDSLKGVGDKLSSVGGYGIAETLSDDFYGHARFDADSVCVGHPFGGNSESWHNAVLLACQSSPKNRRVNKKGEEIQ